MKLDSKYHDMVRIRSGKGSRGTAAESKPTRQHPQCQWKGCTKQGPHRAPKGRGRDGEYFAFCSEHVREYNKSYNYFNGMSDEEVEDYRKEDVTGHRPTWKVSGTICSTATPRWRSWPASPFNRRVMIQGYHGTGKSTHIEQVAIAAASTGPACASTSTATSAAST
jgi:hypothetical protein